MSLSVAAVKFDYKYYLIFDHFEMVSTFGFVALSKVVADK